MKHSTFLFLGTGSSSGIPMIGCQCGVCKSSDPHDKRLRPSGLLMIKGKKIVIDSGPDFRQQALKYQLNTIDGLLITHSHFDHVAGLDELRSYYLINRKNLPVIVSRPTIDDLKRRYDYLFREKSWSHSLTAQLDFCVLEEERGTIQFLDIPIQYMRYEQASTPVNGYRIGSFAYVSDIRNYPKTIFEDLQGVETLVVSALRHETSLMHFNLEEAIAFSRHVGATQTYFIHMGHELDHAKTNAMLPSGFQLAHDGLELELDLRV